MAAFSCCPFMTLWLVASAVFTWDNEPSAWERLESIWSLVSVVLTSNFIQNVENPQFLLPLAFFLQSLAFFLLFLLSLVLFLLSPVPYLQAVQAAA